MYAYRWIRNHLEEHTDTCLPKQSVYDAYRWVDGSGVGGGVERWAYNYPLLPGEAPALMEPDFKGFPTLIPRDPLNPPTNLLL